MGFPMDEPAGTCASTWTRGEPYSGANLPKKAALLNRMLIHCAATSLSISSNSPPLVSHLAPTKRCFGGSSISSRALLADSTSEALLTPWWSCWPVSSASTNTCLTLMPSLALTLASSVAADATGLAVELFRVSRYVDVVAAICVDDSVIAEDAALISAIAA